MKRIGFSLKMKKKLFFFPIYMLLVVYVGGMIKRVMDFATGENPWTAEGSFLDRINYDFFPAIKAFLTYDNIWLILMVAAFFYFGFFFMFTKNKFGIEDERNFTISDKGTYGTSRWMNEKERDKVFDLKKAEDINGTILAQVNGKPFSTRDDLQINKHVAVYGASGTGKSFCFARSYIVQCAKRNESMIVTDPKGELAKDMAPYLKNLGYDVKMFNLVEPSLSDSWNCLQEIVSAGSVDEIQLLSQVFAGIVIENTAGPKPDHFFDNAEKNLLLAAILVIALKKEGELAEFPKTIGGAYKLITALNEEALTHIFHSLPGDHPARHPWNIFERSSDKLKGNIITGLGSRLQVFQAPSIQNITNYNEIDIEKPATQKCAYFAIISDQNSTFDFLSSLFFSFLFIKLVKYADIKGKGGKCDVPVNFLLDEFPNIGSIPDFTKKLSTIRSRDLRVVVIFQNIAQLRNRYPDGLADEIIGNCDTQLFLGCTEMETARFISERTGEMTIKVESEGVAKRSITFLQSIPEYRQTESVGKRFVMNPDEVLNLPNEECLIIVRGNKVLKANKFPFTLHPESKKINPMDIQQYVPKWRQEIISKELKKNEIKEMENIILQMRNIDKEGQSQTDPLPPSVEEEIDLSQDLISPEYFPEEVSLEPNPPSIETPSMSFLKNSDRPPIKPKKPTTVTLSQGKRFNRVNVGGNK